MGTMKKPSRALLATSGLQGKPSTAWTVHSTPPSTASSDRGGPSSIRVAAAEVTELNRLPLASGQLIVSGHQNQQLSPPHFDYASKATCTETEARARARARASNEIEALTTSLLAACAEERSLCLSCAMMQTATRWGLGLPPRASDSASADRKRASPNERQPFSAILPREMRYLDIPTVAGMNLVLVRRRIDEILRRLSELEAQQGRLEDLECDDPSISDGVALKSSGWATMRRSTALDWAVSQSSGGDLTEDIKGQPLYIALESAVYHGNISIIGFVGLAGLVIGLISSRRSIQRGV
ncbi:hypothetical protein VPNG_10328 [Cytospora leucostoma]|uniref:Uncharacterized protein n=1 Tax=Cytospora leucostoma TaxID=1230097 RepID=A0A423VBG2_9PEZI|nr:hypothetical protein VPNG_10328 [Cytospora leucostoma]